MGLDKWKNNEVRKQSQELGARFINEIDGGYIPNVSIRWINEHLGHGLFAEEDLETGAYVGEYTGTIRQYRRSYFEPLNNYCYEYPMLDYLGRGLVIDGTQGNLTRFINHSFNPNLKQTYAFHEGFYHLIFLAGNDITKGSQLSYNYGYTYWYMRGHPVDLYNNSSTLPNT